MYEYLFRVNGVYGRCAVFIVDIEQVIILGLAMLCVVLDGKSSQGYPVNAGIRQGSILDF